MLIFAASSVLLAMCEAVHARWESCETVSLEPLAALRVRMAWLPALIVIVAAVVVLSSHAAHELVYRNS